MEPLKTPPRASETYSCPGAARVLATFHIVSAQSSCPVGHFYINLAMIHSSGAQ